MTPEINAQRPAIMRVAETTGTYLAQNTREQQIERPRWYEQCVAGAHEPVAVVRLGKSAEVCRFCGALL